MHSFSLQQKNTPVRAIAEDSGPDLDYYGFFEILLGSEDVPGLKTGQPVLGLLAEMRRGYEGMKLNKRSPPPYPQLSGRSGTPKIVPREAR